MAAKRDKRFDMMMTSEEKNALERLAAADGISASDVVRMALRHYHERRFGTVGAYKKRGAVG